MTQDVNATIEFLKTYVYSLVKIVSLLATTYNKIYKKGHIIHACLVDWRKELCDVSLYEWAVTYVLHS